MRQMKEIIFMTKVAIMADSNSGFTPRQAAEAGIELLAMPVLVNGHEYSENIDLTREDFFAMLAQGASVSTSQPAPGTLIDRWARLLQDNDEVVYIPMSSGLSNSCQSATLFANDFGGRVHVVDNHRISVTQKQSVYRAKKLADEGKTGAEIKRILEDEAFDAHIYIALDDLNALKKGGRLTPAVAAIGTLLQLKPVLKIEGYKLDVAAKTRGMKLARRTMIKLIQENLDGDMKHLADAGRVQLYMAYSDVPPDVLDGWTEEIKTAFPGCDLIVDPLTLSICCHTGAGAIGIGICEKW